MVPSAQEGQMSSATIKGISDDYFLVDSPKGIVKAKTALSCLVGPEVDDTVLLFQTDRNSFILSVLERCSDDVTIHFRKNANIRAENGTIDIKTKGPFALASQDKIQTYAPTIDTVSSQNRVTSRTLTLNAEKLEMQSSEMNLVSKHLNLFSDLFTQCAKNVLRRIEGVETLTIGNLVQKVRNTMSLISHHAIINAKKDIKIDGERIHMG